MEKIDTIDAAPSKRLYLSIIADYHIKLSLCELIDNAIDNWVYNDKPRNLIIKIDLDYETGVITVEDNSGGIKEDDIPLIVSPGQTRENEKDEIIGIFGVGSKRAVVALARETKIISRFQDERTIMVKLTQEWIEEEDNWELDTYEVNQISKNTTLIELYKLREKIDENEEGELLKHLGETYALFLESEDLSIRLNGIETEPITFDNWSYPPGYEPKRHSGSVNFGEQGKIDVSITGGLTKSHKDDSSSDEYGVYFYCNNRLISKATKNPEVGFRAPIGKPHPRLSICRVLVQLNGPVELMPWNSSKSQIDFKHKTFKEIQDNVRRALHSYAQLSKKWEGEWTEKIFQHKDGEIDKEEYGDFSDARIHIPKVPKGRRKRNYAEIIKRNNKELAKEKPWIVGSYETAIAVELLQKEKNLEQKNRISLLVLDSALEIAFKDFLVSEFDDEAYSESRLDNLFKNRYEVHKEVKKYVEIDKKYWSKIKYYYRKRCKLVHSHVSVQITDEDLEKFRETYEHVVNKLFNIDFSRELKEN